MRDVESKRRSIALLLQQPRVSQLKALFESIKDEREDSAQEMGRSSTPARRRITRLDPLGEERADSHENETKHETSELADAVRDALDLLENHPPPQVAEVTGRPRTDSSLSDASTISTESITTSLPKEDMDMEMAEGKDRPFNPLVVLLFTPDRPPEEVHRICCCRGHSGRRIKQEMIMIWSFVQLLSELEIYMAWRIPFRPRCPLVLKISVPVNHR